MNQSIIVLGDKTSHGGTVISCSPFADNQGKGWARMGDMVACPRCKGVFPISQGDPSLIDDGKPVAYHGCQVACGAILIAGQQLTTTDPSGGGALGAMGAAATDALARGFGIIGAGLMAGYQDEVLNEVTQRFRGRFRLIDAETGEPIPGRAVRVRSTGGQYLTCITDAYGLTQWVERDSAEALACDLQEKA